MKISISTALLFLLMCAGCANPAPVLWGSEATIDGPFLRVQSSYGDLQQAEVTVLQWKEGGSSEPPFERKMTPFDIPLSSNPLAFQFRSPSKGPSLKIMYVDASGRMVNYVQSTHVCISSTDLSDVILQDCKAGLR